jgi:hypothetical protein
MFECEEKGGENFQVNTGMFLGSREQYNLLAPKGAIKKGCVEEFELYVRSTSCVVLCCVVLWIGVPFHYCSV